MRHHQRALPGRRSALDGAHDLSHRLAQLGALVGHGDHGERAVAVEDQGLAAGTLAPDRAQALPVVVRRGHREPVLLEPEGRGHLEGGESRPGAHGGHRHEHVRPVGDKCPDELLLSLVEVVDAVQHDGAGHPLPGSHGGRGQLHTGAVHEPPGVELGDERPVQAVQIGRLAGARARTRRGRDGVAPRGVRRHARLAQIGERGRQSLREVGPVEDRAEVAEPGGQALDQAPHETLARQTGEHDRRRPPLRRDQIHGQATEGRDPEVGHGSEAPDDEVADAGAHRGRADITVTGSSGSPRLNSRIRSQSASSS